MPALRDVFGISTTVPQYTYVDRLGLDARFKYYLGVDRHIVAHGGSKQGKTILRRKHLTEAESIVISCGPDDSLETIFSRILSSTGFTTLKSISNAGTKGSSAELEGGAEFKIPLFGSFGAKTKGMQKSEQTRNEVEEALPGGVSVDTVIAAIKKSHRRLVIEDFHYLAEPERKKLAFALKAFWDAKVFVIIIGIWAEQNLLTVYNSDLSARIEEIDVKWNEQELRQLITMGERALNIRFATMITEDLIQDANSNVGLLQRLLEGLCIEAGVLETSAQNRTIGNRELLDRCRARVCSSAERGYYSFATGVSKGFKNPEKTKLKLYRHIVRVCVDDATDAELVNGIDRAEMLKKIQKYEPDADAVNLDKALIRIDRLQAERDIKPPVLSYGEISRKLVLVDRELLFYRRHNKKAWPWKVGYLDTDDDESDNGETKTGIDGG